MNKKLLTLIATGMLSLSLVACSSGESEKVSEGNATQIQKENNTNNVEKEETNVVLVDDDIVKVTVTEKTVDMFGAGYNVTIENKTDEKIVVQTRETSIDGVMEDPIFSEEITAGKTAKGMIQFMNITELDGLKNLEGKLVVLDENFMDIKSYDMTIE
ncbi:Uncharacterised protein [uncultured Clostridium sp.]|nr:Uncharacterised protein [uncultured Clostridium sp.]